MHGPSVALCIVHMSHLRGKRKRCARELLLALACDGRAALPGLRRECCSAWLMTGVRLRLVRNGRIVPFAGARLFVCFTALVRRWEKELQ